MIYGVHQIMSEIIDIDRRRRGMPQYLGSADQMRAVAAHAEKTAQEAITKRMDHMCAQHNIRKQHLKKKDKPMTNTFTFNQVEASLCAWEHITDRRLHSGYWSDYFDENGTTAARHIALLMGPHIDKAYQLVEPNRCFDWEFVPGLINALEDPANATEEDFLAAVRTLPYYALKGATSVNEAPPGPEGAFIRVTLNSVTVKEYYSCVIPRVGEHMSVEGKKDILYIVRKVEHSTNCQDQPLIWIYLK